MRKKELERQLITEQSRREALRRDCETELHYARAKIQALEDEVVRERDAKEIANKELGRHMMKPACPIVCWPDHA